MLYFLHSSNITCLVCSFTICCCSIYIYRVNACIINIHVYYDVHQRCSRKYEKQNKPLFLQILRPHQWKVIVHAPCSYMLFDGGLFLTGRSIYTEYIFILYLYLRKDITPENERPSFWYQQEQIWYFVINNIEFIYKESMFTVPRNMSLLV